MVPSPSWLADAASRAYSFGQSRAVSGLKLTMAWPGFGAGGSRCWLRGGAAVRPPRADPARNNLGPDAPIDGPIQRASEKTLGSPGVSGSGLARFLARPGSHSAGPLLARPFSGSF